MKSKRIGILTFHCAINYGGVLQAYALSKKLVELGHDVKFINLRPPNISKDKPKRLTDFIFRILFNRFVSKYLPPLTNKIKSNEDLSALNNLFDIFIVGSDQVWNPELSRNYLNNYLFDFVDNNKIKISYAASFGSEDIDITFEEKDTIKKLLNNFKIVTVREKSAQQICKVTFDADSEVVVDPTLLLQKDDYIQLLTSQNLKNEGVVCMKFIKTEEFAEMARYVGQKLSKPVKLVNTPRKFKGIKSIYWPTVGKWLSLINNAEIVITDSFHALCFCIIFKKNFIVIPGKEKRFTRLKSLLHSLGLENRVVRNINELKQLNFEESIDYDKTHAQLKGLKNSSTSILERI